MAFADWIIDIFTLPLHLILAVEGGIPNETVRGLAEMGHEGEVVMGQLRAMFGRQMILRDMETGLLCRGGDPRADGCAILLA